MYNRKIKGYSLWAWMAAALSAPIAQFFGSFSWIWTLLIGVAAGILWLCVEHATAHGRRDWKPITVLQIVFLIFAAGIAASWSGACWITAKHTWVIPIILLALAACAAEGGCQTGARCGAVLFWFLAGMFLLLCAFALPDVKMEWLAPAAIGNENAGIAVAVLLLPAAAAMLPREKESRPWPWAVGLVLCAAILSAVTVGVLSPAVAEKTSGAFFEMVRGIRIFGVAERFEAIVAAAMTLGWFCLLSLLLTVTGHMAETLHEGWGKPGVWLTAVLAGVVSLWGRNAPAWPFALGALVLWYLFPTLFRRKEKNSKNFEKRY